MEHKILQYLSLIPFVGLCSHKVIEQDPEYRCCHDARAERKPDAQICAFTLQLLSIVALDIAVAIVA